MAKEGTTPQNPDDIKAALAYAAELSRENLCL